MSDASVLRSGGYSTSESLLERIQGQAPDPDAWKRFVDLYGPLICGWCCADGLQIADADDVTQEVFAAVYKKIGTFDHRREGGTFRGWLRRITKNATVNWWRIRQKTPTGAGGSKAWEEILEVPDPSPEDAVNGALTRDEKRGILRRAVLDSLNGLSAQTKEIFCRVVLDRQSPADVAVDLKVGPDVVYTAKSRVLKRLKQNYVGLIDFDDE